MPGITMGVSERISWKIVADVRVDYRGILSRRSELKGKMKEETEKHPDNDQKKFDSGVHCETASNRRDRGLDRRANKHKLIPSIYVILSHSHRAVPLCNFKESDSERVRRAHFN